MLYEKAIAIGMALDDRAVISQVQTNNDSYFVKTRQKNTATTGFEVARSSLSASSVQVMV